MKPFATPSFFGTLAWAGLAIAIVSGADAFLARVDRSESQAEAARLFEQGRTLMERGEYVFAIDRIEEALSIDRENRDYKQELAQAQVAAGRTAEAQETLSEILQVDPTDALASREMARILQREHQFPQAISYYHRAIYGYWKQDSAENQLRTRFELIDLLAERGAKEELLAELLPVQDQAPKDLNTAIRIGQLFLLAGSPVRAEEVFRKALQRDSASGDAYAGIGESEFARGNYRTAQRNFQIALRLAPDNQNARQRLDVCAKLLMLDPTMRGLRTAERYHRSLQLVEQVLDETKRCSDPAAMGESQELLTRAENTLAAHVPASRQNDAAESNLDLAEKLWQVRLKACKTPPGVNSPLALVLARLAQ
jgi:tetratricopeptide (TPR) repeat protein